MKKWNPERVAKMLDFSCGGRFGASEAMVAMQSEGVAALCNILRRHRVAYLADEVGMGKTMQALGVIACLCAGKRDARILVISPRQIVQNGWSTEYRRFADHVVLEGAAVPGLESYASLRDWLRELPSTRGISLLRHPSFTRPVYRADRPWQEALGELKLPHIHTFPSCVAMGKPEEVGWNYNLAFAEAVNQWFEAEGVSFDLVVVDEAQCLRNLDRQQTNTVLNRLLRGRVENWLFLSATPAHSGIENIATVLNQYPGRGKLIADHSLKADDGYAALKKQLGNYMVRRPRTFLIGNETVHKRDYRRDDRESLALQCTGPLGILSIATVQKGLVGILGAKDNRFRSGYIASFESLEDSLRNRQAKLAAAVRPDADDDEPVAQADFYQERQPLPGETYAPDESFVSGMSRDFYSRFRFSLPHPKLDGVEQDLALAALGDRESNQPGGVKTVVFCRRVSSVQVLRERLMQRYLRGVEARCRDVWGRELDWETGLAGLEHYAHELVADLPAEEVPNEDQVPDDGLNRLRAAQAEGKWLYNFRATFHDGQRHALFFELNWFERLCRESGVDPAEAAKNVPDQVWADSHAFAMSSGKRYRRKQARYLAWRCLDGYGPEVFGLTPAQVEEWREPLRNILNLDLQPDAKPIVSREQRDSVARETDQLLLFPSFWSCAEKAGLAPLPGQARGCKPNALYWRKIVATVIGQYLRLTDTLVDLHCADGEAHKDGSMLEHFLDWFRGADPDAHRLRQVWQDWMDHYELVFSSAIGAAVGPDGLGVLARKESFDFLFRVDPVVGITGKARAHKLAMQQFNTPGMPYVMVGTDTIREGVNLHLFCDRVMHYGMPWTPGDMEQRIGRVDRYFGRIERRLRQHAAGGGPATLDVLYPYLRDTVERNQIETVMHRKMASDAVVESPLGEGGRSKSDDRIQIDAVPERLPEAAARPAKPYFGTDRHLRCMRPANPS